MNLPVDLPLLTLLAQAAPEEAAPIGGGMNFMVMMVLMIVMMYFLLIRPQRQREKERMRTITELKTGDGIVSAGGIHGIVTNKGEDTVTVKIADNVRIKLDKVSIARVIPKKSAGGGEEETPSIEDSSAPK